MRPFSSSSDSAEAPSSKTRAEVKSEVLQAQNANAASGDSNGSGSDNALRQTMMIVFDTVASQTATAENGDFADGIR